MDATTQAFVTEIVSRKIAENWLYWLLYLAAVFVASFGAAYIKRRAENLATRDDFEELQRQLRQTTKLTEDIKAEIGHREWKVREVNALRRGKLEELVKSLASCHEWEATFIRGCMVGERQNTNDTHIDTVLAIAILYFPSLRMYARGYARKVYSFRHWALETCTQVMSAGDAKVARMKQANDELGPHYEELSSLKKDLETAAQKEMEALLELPVRN